MRALLMAVLLLAGCAPTRYFASAEHTEPHKAQVRTGVGWDAGNGHEVGVYWAPRLDIRDHPRARVSGYLSAGGVYWEWRP